MVVVQTAPAPPRKPSIETLRRFVSCYWLEPELALAMTLRSEALEAFAFEPPNLELNCGDGVFSFLHAGGQFEPAFDVWAEPSWPRRPAVSHAEAFVHLNDEPWPVIVQPPRWRLSVGTDTDRSRLDFAAGLGLYDRLVLRSADEPLPFPQASFATIYVHRFCASRPIKSLLGELRGIVKPAGRILLPRRISHPDDKVSSPKQAALDWQEGANPTPGVAGPLAADEATWRRHFAAAGLAVEQIATVMTQAQLELARSRLTPLLPMPARRAHPPDDATRRRIKAEWTDRLTDLFEPLIRCAPAAAHASPPVELPIWQRARRVATRQRNP